MADKILIIGGTGYIGKFIVAASAKSGHPTFALVRDTTLSDPTKSQIIKSFKSSGVTLVHGDLNDHQSLVKAIKEVDVVISTVGGGQLQDQAKIIAAIKEAGNVKRFLPSEFGNDVDRLHAVEPAKSVFATKVQIRRAIEAEGIPYTYVTSNFFAGYFLPTLVQPGATAPPKDKVIILGDGNPKAVFNKEDDIGTYTIRAVDDPRTLNKILYIKPPQNIYSFNDLVSLWEKKIGKTLERIHVPKEQVLKNIQEAEFPVNVIMAISHSVFIEGDQTNFEIEPSFGVKLQSYTLTSNTQLWMSTSISLPETSRRRVATFFSLIKVKANSTILVRVILLCRDSLPRIYDVRYLDTFAETTCRATPIIKQTLI